MKRFADSHIHMTEDDWEKTLAMLDMMAQKLGVTDTTIHALPYRGIHYNLKALYWKTHYDKIKIRAFGALYEFGTFSDVPPLDQAKTLIGLGCDGIKMMEMNPSHRKKRGFGVDAPLYDPMFSWLEEQDIPVTMHVADPETFWMARAMSPEEIRRGWFYGDGTFPTKQQLYDETLAMLDRHPRLRVQLAHFFFLSNEPAEAERVMRAYPNVLFDLTPGWEMYLGFSRDIGWWHDFFERHSDRIMFGTDSNNYKGDNDKLNELVRAALTHDESEFPMPCFRHDLIRGLNLSKAAVDRITYGNYARFAGEDVRPVAWDKCVREAERIAAAIAGDPAQKSSADWLKAYMLG